MSSLNSKYHQNGTINLMERRSTVSQMSPAVLIEDALEYEKQITHNYKETDLIFHDIRLILVEMDNVVFTMKKLMIETQHLRHQERILNDKKARALRNRQILEAERRRMQYPMKLKRSQSAVDLIATRPQKPKERPRKSLRTRTKIATGRVIDKARSIATLTGRARSQDWSSMATQSEGGNRARSRRSRKKKINISPIGLPKYSNIKSVT